MFELVPGQIAVAPLSPRAMTLLALVALGLLGLASAGLIFARRRRLQKTVAERFKAFRGRAVSLMDELDGLRNRHRTLPETDPDFKVPMTGATLALYNQLSADLDGLWERWLRVMEIWDHTQERIRSGLGLASTRAEEARILLRGARSMTWFAAAGTAGSSLTGSTRGTNRHASGSRERGELAAIHHVVTRGTGVLLPSDLHHREIEAAETTLARPR